MNKFSVIEKIKCIICFLFGSVALIALQICLCAVWEHDYNIGLWSGVIFVVSSIISYLSIKY